MAEQIPYGVTVCLINRLASPVFAEFGRIYGVMDELAKLKETVESINARLLDAEEKQEQDQSHTVKNWISRLKKVLHDADDLFDDFVIEDLRDKVDGRGKIVRQVRNFFSCSNPIVFRSKTAHKIEAIQKKFNDVAKDMSYLNFHPRDRIFEENVSEWRETSSFVEESEIIGREENKKDIINLLMQTNGNQNVSLIAVVGVGGLGKTALAQLVYNDAEVQKFFSKRMWVCVSEDFEVKTLVKKILKSIYNNEVGNLELDQLQNKLRESLNGQRYLLVLDDVWNESNENWNHLRNYLMCGAVGSKILVTTRNKVVAETMEVSTQYPLKGLSKGQSLILFNKFAFRKDAKTIDPSLVSIGEKIVEKCAGVPLAIRAIGSVLRTKDQENEWLSILNGDIRWSEHTNSIMSVLKLSYKHLPIELRQCFAYCCLYPKDWMLEKEELVQLWMAQGYLECSTGMKCLEDVGNDYVKILLMRSFFQDVKMDKYGDIKYFKMHDLMHDLAMDVAGTDCYLHSERKRIVGTPSSHLSLDEGISIPSDLLDPNRVRTILWPSSREMFLNDHSPKMELPIIWNFKSLRVVNLCGLDIKELLGSIGRLKHLRYLELSYCSELTKLPENISNLVQLQTLKLNECGSLEFFAGITKLISLRHFVSRGCTAFDDGMPAGLGKLKSLQTLQKFVVGKNSKFAKLNELKELNNLRGELCIKNLGSVKDVELESKDANLKEKKNLRSLELDWGLEDNKNDNSLVLFENLHPPENLKELEVSNYQGVRYPSWICSLTNIVGISLYDCPHLPRLDQLPFLKHLVIVDMRDDVWCEYISCFSSSSLLTPISTSFFPSLETLYLIRCEQKELIILPPFPRLSFLSIEDCRQLTCMPTFPHVVKKLNLKGCRVKPLIDTLKMNKATHTQEANPKPSLVTNNDTLHSCSFTPLSKLKDLAIRDVDPIGIKELPEEWMQNLISLQRLRIDLQVPLFRSMCHLPAALQELTIDFSEINRDLYEAYKIEEVTTQGQPLHCLRSLQRIQVIGGDYMRELPEWIWNIPSLRQMEIHLCWNLESLPEGMGHLTNLQSLQIWASNSNLKERCQRGTGADWPKIAHIPYIQFY